MKQEQAMADHEPTTLNLPPREPRALVIPHVLTPELAGLLRIGEALADIKDRLAAVMGRPGGPIASELADLASLTIELLDVVEPDPDLEPSLGFDPHSYDLEAEPEHAEPSLCGLSFGWGDDHDAEQDIADQPHDAEQMEDWVQPVRLEVFPQPLFIGARP
jgi:hypothetical protein